MVGFPNRRTACFSESDFVLFRVEFWKIPGVRVSSELSSDMDRNHLIVLIKLLRAYIHLLMCLAAVRIWLIEFERRNYERRSLVQRTFTRFQIRSTEIHRITRESDTNCINELRMDRNAFAVLCEMLKTRGGLLDEGNVTIEEQVATFGCLGAIDGTYIEVTVPESDKPRYQTRKGHIATNVLGVCTRDMNFVYVLSGWEGSSTDSRVLRDAITRHNGLKVPIGNYYLADAGYINGEGFLAPYRGTRYHLREWENGGPVPTNKEEYFNMKHSQARNIIERMYMDIDREENTTITLEDMPIGEDQPNELDSIDVVEASNEWTQWRDDLAQQIRNWDNGEEETLISILQEIVAAGGRCDNGSFRFGTYEHVVSKMREQITGININAKHVQNKIKRLKDKYSAAYDMLNTSGFGWDDARQCVTVDSPEVLEEYLKKHPNKNYTANKPFPTYERLSIIFGKDRATGSMAESATDAVENMNMETEDFVETEGFSVPLSNPSNVASGSAAPSGGETSTRKKKRKAAAADDMTKLIGKGLASVSDEMHQLITVITSSSPNLDGLDILPNELKDMGLNAMQIVRVSMYFGKKPDSIANLERLGWIFKTGICEDDIRRRQVKLFM
ncbi:hypothetical protein OSB04_001608 [Centaurea solstitialis]|uniref:Myb/SANT-like domain-containing protein n=1 Tax=Centaurea solstitialis TaxID=347529 RepID=A0AA38WLW9_9ASTR|nr:hypothetical protein OSB04_001608 [Centaurea solstitialis]